MVVIGIDIGKDVFFAHLRAAEGCPPITPCAWPNIENTVAGCAQLFSWAASHGLARLTFRW